MCKTSSKYELVHDQILLQTPYSVDIVETCRSWAGKFDKEQSGWVLPKSRLQEVQEQLGCDFNDLVQVEVGQEDWTGYEQIRVGWYVLAGRRSRDRQANVYEELVQGTIPNRGGSVKNPAVKPSEDARFRLWVPRDFAVARELQIVTDPQSATVADVETPVTPAALICSNTIERVLHVLGRVHTRLARVELATARTRSEGREADIEDSDDLSAIYAADLQAAAELGIDLRSILSRAQDTVDARLANWR